MKQNCTAKKQDYLRKYGLVLLSNKYTLNHPACAVQLKLQSVLIKSLHLRGHVKDYCDLPHSSRTSHRETYKIVLLRSLNKLLMNS